MILNQPFWAMIDPAGKEIVWDWESPLTSARKNDLNGQLKHILNRAKEHGSWQERPLAWWQGVTIKKVTLTCV